MQAKPTFAKTADADTPILRIRSPRSPCRPAARRGVERLPVRFGGAAPFPPPSSALRATRRAIRRKILAPMTERRDSCFQPWVLHWKKIRCSDIRLLCEDGRMWVPGSAFIGASTLEPISKPKLGPSELLSANMFLELPTKLAVKRFGQRVVTEEGDCGIHPRQRLGARQVARTA